MIEFARSTRKKSGEKRLLRRIEMLIKNKVIIFLSNDIHAPASQIAELYKARWEIEVFFKWIKQNLKIKRFMGRSKNAIEIQLWVAMIVYLLLHMIKNLFKYKGTPLELIRLISSKLLTNTKMADMLSPPKSTCYSYNDELSLFNSSGH